MKVDTKFKKGRAPWNKGLHIYLGGKRFFKGQVPWNKGLTKKDDPRINSYSKKQTKKKIKLSCLFCKKKFEVIPFRKSIAKFCSKKCHARYCIAGKYPCRIAWNKGKKFPNLSGRNSPVWKGGCLTKDGYKVICINGKGVREHRYIFETSLGERLPENMVVHHVNGNRSDNRLENLRLMSRSEHIKLHKTNRWLAHVE